MRVTTVRPDTALSTAGDSSRLDLAAIEKAVLKSKAFAWALITGLPLLGVLTSVLAQLPLFAGLMAGCFLFATGLVCHKAVAAFTGKTLRLLITARLVLVTVLASLLFWTTGTVWTSLVSTALLWLVADRLMGRRALYDLWKLTRPGDQGNRDA